MRMFSAIGLPKSYMQGKLSLPEMLKWDNYIRTFRATALKADVSIKGKDPKEVIRRWCEQHRVKRFHTVFQEHDDVIVIYYQPQQPEKPMISEQTKADLKVLSETFAVLRRGNHSEMLRDFVEAGAEAVNEVCKKALSEVGIEHDPCGEYDFVNTNGNFSFYLTNEDGDEVFLYGEGSV